MSVRAGLSGLAAAAGPRPAAIMVGGLTGSTPSLEPLPTPTPGS